MKQKKSLLEEIAKFLNEIQEKDFDPPEQKTKEQLIMKENVEKNARIFVLCEGDGLITKNTVIEQKWNVKEGKTKREIKQYRISLKGLNFLKNYKKEKIQEENNRTTLFLTTTLVITTISSFFIQLKIINPLTLSLIYLLMTLLIWKYFKRNKQIKI